MSGISTSTIVKALSAVPEKNLRIIELAGEVMDKRGELDYKLLVDRQKDVNLAIAEAKSYAGATKSAVNALERLEARSK